MTRRTIALEKVKWSKKKIARLAQVLMDEAMSSEDSCAEEGENGNMKVTGYKIRRLSWESQRFTRAKKELDESYKSCLSQRAKDRLLPRTVHCDQATKPAPEKFPKWAVTK